MRSARCIGGALWRMIFRSISWQVQLHFGSGSCQGTNGKNHLNKRHTNGQNDTVPPYPSTSLTRVSRLIWTFANRLPKSSSFCCKGVCSYGGGQKGQPSTGLEYVLGLLALWLAYSKMALGQTQDAWLTYLECQTTWCKGSRLCLIRKS